VKWPISYRMRFTALPPRVSVGLLGCRQLTASRTRFYPERRRALIGGTASVDWTDDRFASLGAVMESMRRRPLPRLWGAQRSGDRASATASW
jgi:hypothetical protein